MTPSYHNYVIILVALFTFVAKLLSVLLKVNVPVFLLAHQLKAHEVRTWQRKEQPHPPNPWRAVNPQL